MMIASGLGLSALDEQVIGVIFVLLYLYYSIVSDGYLVANMCVWAYSEQQHSTS